MFVVVQLNTNIPSGGGNKKQGLVSYVGVSDHVNRALLIGANGSAQGRQQLFVQNQLSGVSSSEFRRASSYARADGVHPQTKTTVATPQNLTGVELIASYTDQFIYRNVILKNSVAVASLFCPNGMLWGTVSTELRTGVDIKLYFDFFSNLPELEVTVKNYMITQIPGSQIWVNNAYITWKYYDDTKSAYQTINTRMQFTYNGSCIYELYSAQLPAINEELLGISGKP